MSDDTTTNEATAVPPVVETATPAAPEPIPAPPAPEPTVAKPKRPDPVLTASISKQELFDKGWELPDFIVSLQKEADEKGVVIAEVDFDKTSATFNYRGYAQVFIDPETDGGNL